MLCRLTISSQGATPPLPGSLISREILARYTQAGDVLEQAKAGAKQLLREAHEQREHLLEKAGLEIWQRADAQFKRWEAERQVLYDNLEQYATSIANQAIRLLLEETPPLQRIGALIKQLLACHIPAIKATLVCNPHELEKVRQCLGSGGGHHWTLHAENTIEPQTLILKTDEGDFRIDWISMVNAIMKDDEGLVEKGDQDTFHNI
ncbi:type III secretion protein L [Pseudomonas cedrina]|uniref:Type III secretion protein n=2 Tax=Pseudomonas cedrina TaxID=651740 RepID=A0A1V2KBR1_PSECE|nr:type III secretion system stator protein SctL [Pseudomonas cedrina]ONH54944.1 type III secretion protein [Pseudomonas cedrina subsp. cedrina]SDT65946.1 type III secretion protein L [Pseudomonas cedrina]